MATLWNASLNQNLLHPDVAPVARDIEAQVIGWLAPLFGMDGGHMTPGSTVGNLTALWAARELRGVKRVVASEGAHLSIGKAAHILGLAFEVTCPKPLTEIILRFLPRMSRCGG
jgi:L-2,4-diaminobutyrate decarboxylase